MMDQLLENVVAEVVEDLCKQVVKKEKRRLYLKKYREDNKEKKRLSGKKWYEKNREMRLVQTKKYYQENKEKVRLYGKKYREENKLKKRLYQKKYDQENKEKTNAYNRKRRREDPDFKLCQDVRGRIHHALKSNTKSARSLELLGCSSPEYRKYLEDQFHDSGSGDTMTWDNHGSCHGHWQIDHRVPICSFDLSQPAEQKKAFHYTNTQPLWYDVHCAKGTVVPDTHEWRDGAWHLK